MLELADVALISNRASPIITSFGCMKSLYHSFSPGCSSEPGYFGAGHSLPGYAGISVGGPEDCAIKCARVEGCAGWAFALQTIDE